MARSPSQMLDVSGFGRGRRSYVVGGQGRQFAREAGLWLSDQRQELDSGYLVGI